MQYIYLVEGETERALLLAIGVLGKIEIFNLWQEPILKIERKFKPNSKIIVVYDTDVLVNEQRFKQNLNHLIKNKRLQGILQQTYNLEDELARALSCSKRQLLNYFNAVADSEFKNKFKNTQQLGIKLQQLNLDQKVLWSEKIHHNLRAYEHYQLKFIHLVLK